MKPNRLSLNRFQFPRQKKKTKKKKKKPFVTFRNTRKQRKEPISKQLLQIFYLKKNVDNKLTTNIWKLNLFGEEKISVLLLFLSGLLPFVLWGGSGERERERCFMPFLVPGVIRSFSVWGCAGSPFLPGKGWQTSPIAAQLRWANERANA